MNKDFRITCSFPRHHKTQKLIRRLGMKAVTSMIFLWSHVAENKPMGILDGMDLEDIAIVSQWDEDPETFVSTLVEIGFLEKDPLRIHQWSEHNGYASNAEKRSSIARAKADIRWKKKENAVAMQQQCSGNARALQGSCTGNAPSPTPTPTPTPDPTPDPSPEISWDEIRQEFARESNGKKNYFVFSEAAKIEITRCWFTLIEQGAKNPMAAIKAVIKMAMAEMLAQMEKTHTETAPIYFEPEHIFKDKHFSRYLSLAKPPKKGEKADASTAA